MDNRRLCVAAGEKLVITKLQIRWSMCFGILNSQRYAIRHRSFGLDGPIMRSTHGWFSAFMDRVQYILLAHRGKLGRLGRIERQPLCHAFIALEPKIDQTDRALKVIQGEVNDITKEISTASTLVGVSAKVLSLFPPV